MMRGIYLLGAVSFVALPICGISLPRAADISYSAILRTILIDGALQRGDAEKLRGVFDGAGGAVDKLYLHSPGGDFMTAIEAGYWVREHHLETYASGPLCVSACAYLWLGGEALYANGVVSLHMPFYRTSMVTVAIPDEGVAAAAWYLAKMGYDQNLMTALLVVSQTESNETFPITGPNTALFHIDYRPIPDEGRYKEALKAARARKGSQSAAGP